VGGVVLDQAWLALTVALVALGLIAITSGLLLVDMHMASKARQHAAQLEQANQKLRHAATHDSLTGLPNRALLADRLQQAIAQAQRQGTTFALVAFDLDRFKAVNDSLGHQAGDELLREMALRLLPLLRASDTLARIGGDEFVALLPEAGERESASLVLHKIQQEIARPMKLYGSEVQVSSSIGVAFYPTDARDANTLQKHADAALYEAKDAGRDNFQFFAPSMAVHARERQELEEALGVALANHQFLLHYQPQVDLRSGRVEKMEALLRWQHPARGLLLPADFLEVAEETGLIRSIGAWALREACGQLRRWHEAGYGELCVTINVSAEQLQQADLVEVVRQVLRDTKADPGSVEMEFTESALMADVEHSGQVLTQLVRMGVRISLDDFGTGYSNLNYLRRLPLHGVKIDRRFIHGMETTTEDAEIVRAMVSLAHCLRLQASAEGVETTGQLDFLRATGCDSYQGYAYSAPLTSEQCAEILRPITATQRLRVLGRLARARLLGEPAQQA
jgi:diguanylate cyclase (GGDEF)-like protein